MDLWRNYANIFLYGWQKDLNIYELWQRLMFYAFQEKEKHAREREQENELVVVFVHFPLGSCSGHIIMQFRRKKRTRSRAGRTRT